MKFRGKTTFRGEIDRQHIMPQGRMEDVDRAVQNVRGHLWEDIGGIARCEPVPGARPEDVFRVIEAWDRLPR